MDPDTAYRVTKACVDAVDIHVMFKMTPQCVNMAGVALAVERAGAAAISANDSFYGCWIDHETGTFLDVPFPNEDKCDQCGVCERICPYGALSFNKSKNSVPMLNRD